MKVDQFDFDLPPRFIADRPAVPRDAARLLEVCPEVHPGADRGRDRGRCETLRDHVVRELPALLRSGDLLVFNDTRVIPGRLFGRRGAARIEVTLHRAVGDDRWRAFARPARKLRVGDAVAFAENFTAEVRAKGEDGEVELRFDRSGGELMRAVERFGRMPLPPYIKRPEGADARDREDYQTIFAAKDGAVAAPTAGLHFTPDLLRALDERGIRRVAVTLHVGAGSFLPVKVEDTRDHVMHAEVGIIEAATAEAVNRARESGGRIVAVGTTSLRLLETAADASGHVRPFSGSTDLFIAPGYRFKAVDLLLTNFHLPRSTLFMLVCAFAGLDCMKAAYEHAKAAGYRFYSYGDCCLLHPETPR